MRAVRQRLDFHLQGRDRPIALVAFFKPAFAASALTMYAPFGLDGVGLEALLLEPCLDSTAELDQVHPASVLDDSPATLPSLCAARSADCSVSKASDLREAIGRPPEHSRWVSLGLSHPPGRGRQFQRLSRIVARGLYPLAVSRDGINTAIPRPHMPTPERFMKILNGRFFLRHMIRGTSTLSAESMPRQRRLPLRTVFLAPTPANPLSAFSSRLSSVNIRVSTTRSESDRLLLFVNLALNLAFREEIQTDSQMCHWEKWPEQRTSAAGYLKQPDDRTL